MSSKLKCCPYCGSEEYYIKQHATGELEWRMRFDGKEAENEAYYEPLMVTNTSKFAWCLRCDKKLFKLEG